MNRLAAMQMRMEDAETAFHAAVSDESWSLEMPFSSLQRVVRRVPGGEVIVVQGRTGNGKTTLTNSLVSGFMGCGVGCYVIPTETPAKDWTKRLVCARLGESFAYWHTGQAKADVEAGVLAASEYEARRQRLNEEHLAVAQSDQLWVKPLRFAALHDIPLYYAEARAAGMSVVLLDHVDLVRGTSDDRYQVSAGALDAILEAGQQHGIVSIVCSQADASLVKGSVLDQYAPPTLGNMYMGQHKNHAAAVVLGLFRPRRPGLTVAEVKRINEKVDPPTLALMPNRMGIVVNKHRFGEGEMEGQRCVLAVARGVVRERTPEEVAQDEMEHERAKMADADATTRPPTRRNDRGGV